MDVPSFGPYVVFSLQPEHVEQSRERFGLERLYLEVLKGNADVFVDFGSYVESNYRSEQYLPREIDSVNDLLAAVHHVHSLLDSLVSQAVQLTDL